MSDEQASHNEEPEKAEFSLELDFVPAWARTPPANPYANREEREERFSDRPGRGDRRGDRRGGPNRRPGAGTGGRPGGGRGFRRDGPPGGHGPRRPDDRRRGEGGGERPVRTGDRPATDRPASDRPFRRDGRKFEGKPRSDRPRGERPQGDRPRDGRRFDGPRRPPLERMNVSVRFLPDRDCLARVVEDIRATGRAYPLKEIANRFLAREELYHVKLEMPPPEEGKPRESLAQCIVCRRVFRSRANAEAHALDTHLDQFFDVEETEVEVPAAEFTCIARCGISGTLLGPPNYHGYHERLHELWSTRFANMSKPEYLGRIETLRDPDLIEKWRDEMRRQTVFRHKPEGAAEKPEDVPPAEEPVAEAKAEAPEEAAPVAEAEAPAEETPPAAEEPAKDAEPGMSRKEATEWARINRMSHLVRESPRCSMPGKISRQFDHPALRAAVSSAWTRESRFPLTLSLALRPAFKHMHLHLFKVNGRETYVTAIAPAPVDITTLEDIPRKLADYIAANPGTTRRQLLDALCPGLAPDSPEAAELLTRLGEMLMKGNVIEFFNGTLTLPASHARKPAEAKRETPPEETKAEEPVEEVTTEEAPQETPEEIPPVEETLPPEVAAVEEPAAKEAEQAPEESPREEAEAPAEETLEEPAAEPAEDPGEGA